MNTHVVVAGIVLGCFACRAEGASRPVETLIVPSAAATMTLPPPPTPWESAVQAFLDPRPGETRADRTPVPGIHELSETDRAVAARCETARRKAESSTGNQPTAKQGGAVLAAMTKIDTRCIVLTMASKSGLDAMAKLQDTNAHFQLRTLSAALARTPEPCVDGAPNPVRSGCLTGTEEMRWDGQGWSCLARSLSQEERKIYGLIHAYSYSFRTDARLRTYEFVGRGCAILFGVEGADSSETEIVLRGKLGEEVRPDTPIYRRTPTVATEN